MGEAASIAEQISASKSTLSPAEYARLARRVAALEPVAGVRELRVGLLSSCTLQFIEPSFLVEGFRRKLQLRPYFGPFGQFEQLISDPRSALHASRPDALVLVMRPEDLDPDVFHRFYAAGRPNVFAAVIDRLLECVIAFRAHSSAPVLVANFAPPAWLPLGPFEANDVGSSSYALSEANRQLRARLSEVAGAAVWDYAGLVRASGAEEWCDPRLWALGRIPVASARQPVLARHLARSLSGLVRPPAKCLVLDLDNTLWGGVLGDDGLEGIQLGDDYPGNVFKSFQRAVLSLTDRGILLAVVSKNDQELVGRALQEHPEMVIRSHHLSAMRVNWNVKSQNLQEIAVELNLGLDALVHFDDNPMERAEIAANAPQVQLIDVPRDPIDYERALHECGMFDAAVISAEDRQRVQMYREERARDVVRTTAGTVHDYLAALEMVAEVGAVTETNLGRVAQLVSKTNQFNLTTRRHSQAEIGRMCADPRYAALYIRVRDRFGDLGLIGTALLAFKDDEAVIDSLVMSCRAMGRQVEVALLAELVDTARSRGCRTLIGEYRPTARNHVVAELYPQLGFEKRHEDADGSRYRLDLSQSTVEWPAAIRRAETAEALL